MKLVNFGSCNIDYVYSVDHIVTVGETESTEGMGIFPGGKGLNQSIAAAKAGAAVYHAGCIGEDGGMLYDLLKESGVNVSNIKKVDGKNGHAIIQLSKRGENSIFLYPGSNEMLTEEFIDEVLSCFEKDDMLLLQNEVNLLEYIIKKAYEKGMKIVLNPSPCNEIIKKIDLGMLSYIVLNEVETKLITGIDNEEESITYLKKNYPSLKVMLTLGKRGCVYFDSEQMHSCPSFKVEAVDTTAAGDTFTGYFLASVLDGIDYPDAIKIATAASALSVSKKGAAPSIPTKAEVLSALEFLKPNTDDKDDKAKQRKDLICKYVEEHIADACLEGLADLLGYSSVYTGELVKKTMGMPFSKLLQKTRGQLSAKMLTETDLSIEEIIYRVGYKNESFFRKIFKEMYGKAPLEYRKSRKN